MKPLHPSTEAAAKRAENRRRLLKWELCWIPVEIAMVGTGLWLVLGLKDSVLGTMVLVVALSISVAVRSFHYTGVPSRQKDKPRSASEISNPEM